MTSLRSLSPALAPLLVACALPVLAGCGAAARSSRRGPRSGTVEHLQMEEVRISASRSGDGVSFETYDAQGLFERGNRELQAGRCEAALPHFERVAREFGSSRFLSPALYNLAHCLERLGRLDAAVERFRELVRRVPRSRDVRDALYRLASLEERRQAWDGLLAVADQLLTREDLSSADRLEAMARRGSALVGLRRLEDAERQGREATQFFRMRSQFDPIPDDTFAAQAQFVVAESWRLRAEAIGLPPGTAQEQHEALEARSRAILMAQTEYFNTIRVTNPEWAAAAGYRIGEMYRALFEVILAAPIPPDVPRGGEDVYRAELRSLFRPLLRNALRYWELTVLMNERTGVRGEWVDRTTAELERLRRVLLDDVPGGDRAAPAGAPRSPGAPPVAPAPEQPPAASSP